jgi:uncharacterized protein with HEPN domain
MIEGVSLADYRTDIKLRRAVERCVEIISEASRHIPVQLKNKFPSQPWDEIAGSAIFCDIIMSVWMISSCGK